MSSAKVRGLTASYTTVAADNATEPTSTGYTDLPCITALTLPKSSRQASWVKCLQKTYDDKEYGALAVDSEPSFEVPHKDKTAVDTLVGLFAAGTVKQWRIKHAGDTSGIIFDAIISSHQEILDENKVVVSHMFELSCTGRFWGSRGFYATLPAES